MLEVKRKALPKSVRIAVYQKCNGHCAYCGCDLQYKDMQVDHVIPLNGWNEQGTDTVDNMLPACRSCNHYKSRSTLEGFRKMVEAMPDTLMRDNVTYKNAVRFGLVIPNKKPVVFYFEKITKLKFRRHIMTKEQIHEALCKAPDEDKMRLAIACQLNGIDVRDIETGLANVLTGVQKAIKPAIEYYRYLGGIIDEKSGL